MGFIALNRSISSKLYHKMPQAKKDVYIKYENKISELINTDKLVIADVGGGRRCEFKKRLKKEKNIKVIGIDISQEELDLNKDVDEKICCDVTKEVPLHNSVDLITCKTLLEHLDKTENFIKNASHILKGGGKFIMFYPNKFSLFAIINQIVPTKLSKLLLYTFIPDSKGRRGFKAYYNNCYISATNKLLKKHGFKIIEQKYNFCSSAYFTFFLPFFLASAIWEYIIMKFDIKLLCSYVYILAEKEES